MPSATTLDNQLGGLRLDEIHSFLVLAEELHFTKAAARLNISPGGLSRRIAHLEHALRFALLHRTTRSVSLTPEGLNFAPAARNLIVQLKAIRDSRGMTA